MVTAFYWSIYHQQFPLPPCPLAERVYQLCKLRQGSLAKLVCEAMVGQGVLQVTVHKLIWYTNVKPVFYQTWYQFTPSLCLKVAANNTGSRVYNYKSWASISTKGFKGGGGKSQWKGVCSLKCHRLKLSLFWSKKKKDSKMYICTLFDF